jgi:hypothetical protein
MVPFKLIVDEDEQVFQIPGQPIKLESEEHINGILMDVANHLLKVSPVSALSGFPAIDESFVQRPALRYGIGPAPLKLCIDAGVVNLAFG